FLRLCRSHTRPRRRAAQKRDEVAPLHCLMLPALSTERIAHLATAQRLLQRGISIQPMSQMGHTRSFGGVGSMSGLPESGHGWKARSTSFCEAHSRALRPYLSSHDSAGATAGAGLGACDNSLETIHFGPEYCVRAVFLRRGEWGDENGRTGDK